MKPSHWSNSVAVRTMLRDEPYGSHEIPVELRLTYAGPLLGASGSNTRAQHKHDIRCVFHQQLKRFWEQSHLLTRRTGRSEEYGPVAPYVDCVAEKYGFGGFRFAPLVTEELGVSCSLDILFLRPTAPGEILRGGDIDNRLKTLFDALRRPQNNQELAGNVPENPEGPFFCLLEDDRLITRVSVETDSLLEPVGHNPNDVRLVISVKIMPYRSSLNNLDFIGN